MASDLEGVRNDLLACASALDVPLLTPAQAGSLIGLCSQIEASAASLKALLAARAADGPSWKQEGFRSPQEQLARRSGMSPTAARRALETGRRLAEQPEVASAALSGRLSLEQASVVADGVAANPSKAAELLEVAARHSMPELQEEVARAKAAVTDQETRRRIRHSRRYFRNWVDRDGALHAHLYGHPEDGVSIWQMLDPVRRRLNAARRQAARAGGESGDEDSLEALDYDAFLVLSRLALGAECELSLAEVVDLGLFPQLADLAMSLASPDEPGADFAEGGVGAAAGKPCPETAVEVAGGSFDNHDVRDGDPSLSLFGPVLPPTVATTTGPAPGSQETLARRQSVRSGRSRRAPIRSRTPATDQGGRHEVHPPGVRSASRGRRQLAGRAMKVNIRVDLDTLLRGVARDGEQCEIDGYGPVPVSVIEQIIRTDNPFIVGVLTKSKRVVGVYHHGRQLTARQASAMDFLQSRCPVEGCSARTALQYDHREDWSKTHFTIVDLIDRLCPHHHGLKTRANWALVGTGPKRPFVPPTDPRHPRYHPGEGPGPERCHTASSEMEPAPPVRAESSQVPANGPG
jgi:hypothetical protein